MTQLYDTINKIMQSTGYLDQSLENMATGDPAIDNANRQLYEAGYNEFLSEITSDLKLADQIAKAIKDSVVRDQINNAIQLLTADSEFPYAPELLNNIDKETLINLALNDYNEDLSRMFNPTMNSAMIKTHTYHAMLTMYAMHLYGEEIVSDCNAIGWLMKAIPGEVIFELKQPVKSTGGLFLIRGTLKDPTQMSVFVNHIAGVIDKFTATVFANDCYQKSNGQIRFEDAIADGVAIEKYMARLKALLLRHIGVKTNINDISSSSASSNVIELGQHHYYKKSDE